MKRRELLLGLPLLHPTLSRLEQGGDAKAPFVQTVRGPVPASELGLTLAHEHVLVDFVGADRVSPDRYSIDEAYRVALPHLQEAKRLGTRTIFECTPAYLGRDPRLLRRLAEASGVNLVTNTGYYGANNDKHVPVHAYRESASKLAARWTAEARGGIDGTGIRPGFIKSGVDAGRLSEIDRKLVTAAARCHLDTGLTIAVHTGDGAAALDILAVLETERVDPAAYVYVHAQNARDRAVQAQVAAAGAWVELDGIAPDSLEGYVEAVLDLAGRGHLGRLLVSHDAGWYHVGEPGGGSYRGYGLLFESFVPSLLKRGLSEKDVRTLLVGNPARAFSGYRQA
ncbi:MAG TPA: phosphotriesterase [Vicinamibacteria bacterium]|nr:phosphotriesterase [Vicinamibacteria bacterium]